MVPQGPTGLENGLHLAKLAELGGMQVCFYKASCGNT